MSFDIVYLTIVLAVVFASMVLHELMHGLTAYWLGDDTAKKHGRLTLNPMKHIDPFLTILLPLVMVLAGGAVFGGAKPVPFRPDRVKGGEWGAALVGAVGPLTNLVLAFIFFALIVWTQADTGLFGQFLTAGVMVNLGFFAFNILPIPPLDGSRVLYAIAPDYVRRGMEVIERMGLIVIFAIVLLLSVPLSIVLGEIIKFFLNIFSQIFGVPVIFS